MPSRRKSLARLARLSRVREVQRYEAARAACKAKGISDRLTQVGIRSAALAAAYQQAYGRCDAQELARQHNFTAQMQWMTKDMAKQRKEALVRTDKALSVMAAAQKRRDLVRDKYAALHRSAASTYDHLDHVQNRKLAHNVKDHG